MNLNDEYEYRIQNNEYGQAPHTLHVAHMCVCALFLHLLSKLEQHRCHPQASFRNAI